MNGKLMLAALLLIMVGSISAKLTRAKQNFYCNDILNEQIKMEFEASNVYLSLANYFGQDSVALHGFSKKFDASWKEELSHAEKLIKYVIQRGGTVQTPAVPRPVNETKWASMNVCEIINIVLGLEMKVNEHLHQVHECGESQGRDPHLQDFIEGEYLKEQFEANKELADLLTKIERITLHVNADGSKVALCNGLGLHIIDKEL